MEERLLLSLPGGGLPVGAVVAAFLDCPHQIVVVKKIRAAAYPDLLIGTVTEERMVTLNFEQR